MNTQKRYAVVVAFFSLVLLSLETYRLGWNSTHSWDKFIIFLVFMTISELYRIPVNHGFLSLDFGFIYYALFTFGIVPAAYLKTLSTLFSQYHFHRDEDPGEKIYILSFNVGQHLISLFAAVGVYFLTKGSLNTDNYLLELMAQGAGILTFFLLNNFLVGYYLYLKAERFFLKIFMQTLWENFMIFMIAFPAGVIMVRISAKYGFYAAFLIIIPYMVLSQVYRLYVNLSTTNQELTALYDVAATMTSTLNVDEVLEVVLTSIQSVAPWDTACLFAYQQNVLVPVIYDGITDEAFKEVKIKIGEGFIGGTFIHGRCEIVNNCDRDPRFTNLPGVPDKTKSLIAVPLIYNKEILGAITLTSNKNNVYTKKHLTLMSILANQAAVAIYNARLFDKTAQMAVTDGLTNIYNHRYIYEQMERLINKVKVSGGVLSLIMIDVDHFKACNDIHGHVVGDEILQNLARLLSSSIRSKDILGRYGGEEFAIILPGIPSNGAFRVAERIRKKVEQTPLAKDRSGKDIYVTISAGIASCPDHAETVEDLVCKADKALLFGAKQSGRNRVVLYKKDLME